MTGKIHFKLATFYIFFQTLFVSGFGFVAQFFKLRFYQSYQCQNNCMCSHFLFVQMLEKNGVILNTSATSSMGAKQYILSFQILFQLAVLNFV